MWYAYRLLRSVNDGRVSRLGNSCSARKILIVGTCGTAGYYVRWLFKMTAQRGRSE